jgi:hypothetical protein
MCQYYEEDKTIIACDLTIVDSEGHMTCLQKQEELYYENELSQFANWFKYLLNSIGYEFIDEVQFIQYRDKFNEEDAVYSSEDF